jgi:epsilon-lactone hydrolase
MSIQNFFINRFLKSRLQESMKLSPEVRFRRSRRFMAKDFSKVGAHIDVRADRIAGVNVEWVASKTVAADPDALVCLYLHGGGFVMGGPSSHRDMAAFLAETAQIRMLMVDYRLAPEHPYPAALQDVRAVYQALWARGVPSQGLVMGGDSAGGNLTLAALQSLRDEGLPLPRGFFLFSPWLDLTQQGASMQSNAGKDVMLNRQFLEEVAALYAAGMSLGDPGLSPLFGDLAGLPPCLQVVSRSETLLDDARRLHQLLTSLGAQSTCLEWSHTPHAFPVMARLLPEARDALRQTADFIARVARGTPPASAAA